MSTHTVACPSCHAALRSAKPLPPEKLVRCPQCGSQFSVAASIPKPAAPLPDVQGYQAPTFDFSAPDRAASSASRKTFAVALITAILIAGAAIAGAIYLTQRPAQVADKTDGKDRRDEEEQGRLAEERKKLDQEKRRLEYLRLLNRGETAVAKQRYEEAEEAYAEALKLFPDDREAAIRLANVRASLAAAAKTREDEEKRQAEFTRLMDRGKEAMTNKQYAAAVRAFETAILLVKGDAAAAQTLDEAKEALANDQDEKKKLADYQNHMDAGRKAMAAQRFTDAIREFAAAQKVWPGDADAAKAQQIAEKRLAAVQEQEKRGGDYAKLMKKGDAALRSKRYDEAVDAYAEAVRLFPGERQAEQALKEAKQARAEAKNEATRLMTMGDAAMRLQRYEEAMRAYAQASQLLPNDAAIAKALADTQRVLDNLNAGQAAYLRFMMQAAAAMRNERYAEAIRAYTEVLRLVPNDLDATQGLRDARAADAREARRRMEFDKQMRAGAAAVKQRQYADAVRAYTEALKLYPDEPQATAGLSKAKYSQAMADGQAAMNAKRYGDAVRNFEDALKEMPGDTAATNALRQAKALLKKSP